MFKQVFRHYRTVVLPTVFRAFVIATTVAVPAHAAQLAEPAGPALLEIVGNLERTNSTTLVEGESAPVAVFDITMLESLPPVTIKTQTPWTEGVAEFTGVRMDALLAHVGASSKHLVLEALDEYSVEAVEEPFESYPIIIAYKLNGEHMSVRELGPLWLMYPFDDYPELNSEQSRAHCVWQLTRITVH